MAESSAWGWMRVAGQQIADLTGLGKPSGSSRAGRRTEPWALGRGASLSASDVGASASASDSDSETGSEDSEGASDADSTAGSDAALEQAQV